LRMKVRRERFSWGGNVSSLILYLWCSTTRSTQSGTHGALEEHRGSTTISIVLRRREGIRSHDESQLEGERRHYSSQRGAHIYIYINVEEQHIYLAFFLIQGAGMLKRYGGSVKAMLIDTFPQLFKSAAGIHHLSPKQQKTCIQKFRAHSFDFFRA